MKHPSRFCSEFPNDNPKLHDGALWICQWPRAMPRAVAVAKRVVAVADAGVENAPREESVAASLFGPQAVSSLGVDSTEREVVFSPEGHCPEVLASAAGSNGVASAPWFVDEMSEFPEVVSSLEEHDPEVLASASGSNGVASVPWLVDEMSEFPEVVSSLEEYCPDLLASAAEVDGAEVFSEVAQGWEIADADDDPFVAELRELLDGTQSGPEVSPPSSDVVSAASVKQTPSASDSVASAAAESNGLARIDCSLSGAQLPELEDLQLDDLEPLDDGELHASHDSGQWDPGWSLESAEIAMELPTDCHVDAAGAPFRVA